MKNSDKSGEVDELALVDAIPELGPDQIGLSPPIRKESRIRSKLSHSPVSVS